MYDISKIWSNLFWFGPAIASSNFDEVQKISKSKIFGGEFFFDKRLRIIKEEFPPKNMTPPSFLLHEILGDKELKIYQ